MLRARQYVRHEPSLIRSFYATTEKIKTAPVKSVENRDGVTDVYIVRYPKANKKNHIPLSQRLKAIIKGVIASPNPKKDTEDYTDWHNIPSQVQYERKFLIEFLIG